MPLVDVFSKLKVTLVSYLPINILKTSILNILSVLDKAEK